MLYWFRQNPAAIVYWAIFNHVIYIHSDPVVVIIVILPLNTILYP